MSLCLKYKNMTIHAHHDLRAILAHILHHKGKMPMSSARYKEISLY